MFKVVSFMATRGRKLPQLRIEGLHITATSYVQSIYGVIAMLESSPYVEKLYILGSEPGKVRPWFRLFAVKYMNK